MSDLFPPFAPDPDEPRRRRFKPVPFRMIAPNVITLLALCLGLTAIRLAYEGRLEPAAYAIVVAALLDGVDGRVARLLKGTSRFGAELDSLADFVNFGVAPALVLYSFLLHEMRSIGWIVALVFAIAAALRLARFNVMLDDPNRPEWQKNFFVGMAAPAGACTVLLPLYLHFLGVPAGRAVAAVALVYVLAIAFLMVSTVPTFSGKTVGKYRAAALGSADLRGDRRLCRPSCRLYLRGARRHDGGLPGGHPDRRRSLRAAPPGRGRAGIGSHSRRAAVRPGVLRPVSSRA